MMSTQPDPILEHARRLATPVDVRRLVARGVIRPRGLWYEVLDAARLPPDARCQVRAVRAAGASVLVQFGGRNRVAERLYAELAGSATSPPSGPPAWWAGVVARWASWCASWRAARDRRAEPTNRPVRP